MVNEDRAERMRVCADRLSQAERALTIARKNYGRALREWDDAAQVKLDETL
ncbi:MAG: hypothetical protein M0Q12_09120 [Synergistaceae bacterium]|jgi:hypothetical protein|nr:hypothetical protein [Synergistaceae bacterium]